MQLNEIFPAGSEPAAGLNCDAAYAQVDDVSHAGHLPACDQFFQRHFETLMLTLILDKSATDRSLMILHSRFSRTAASRLLPVWPRMS